MAQGDIFQNFINQTRGLGVTTEQLNSSLEKLYESKMNIVRANEKLKKSDLDTFNVLKRTLDVGSKIANQMKDNKKMSDQIKKSKKEINQLDEDILNTQDQKLKDALIKLRDRKKLEFQVANIQLKHMQKSIPLLGRMGSSGVVLSNAMVGVGAVLGTIFKVLTSITTAIIKVSSVIIKTLLNPLKKAFNIFLELQSTVGNIAADIGLTGIESRTLLNNFASLTLSAMKFGGSMKDVATVIQQFSEVTGKNRFFNEREIEQLVELGLGTGLGVEGASELAASFDNIGLSLEKTINLTDKARNMSAKMNLNVTKVLKTYQGLVQSLTGIGFGKGLDNLTKLAAKATAIRFDIVKSTEAFSDAFFDPEKAVEASARMQVLGGRFAQSFGDPMQLAFESMTDPTALAEKFANTVSSIVAKDSKGNYFIPPAERKSLKLAAEALGQSYEDAVGTAIEQAKIADKMVALNKAGFSVTNFSEEDRLAIAGLMRVNESGQFVIKNSAGVETLLSNLTDKNQLKQILETRKANENAAIQRKNLMERLSLIVDRFMMGFSNVFTKLFGLNDSESFLQMIENSGQKIASFINDKILGSNGLAETFKYIVDKGKEIFEKISNIFNSDGGIGSKIKSTLGVLFSDLLKPILGILLPYLQAGWGAVLSSMRGIPIVGTGLGNIGDKLQREAIMADTTGGLKSIYNENAIEELQNKGGGGGLAAVTAAGKNAGLMYAGKKMGLGNLAVKVGEKLYNKMGINVASSATAKGISNLGFKAATLGTAGKIPIAGDILRILIGLGYDGLYKGDWKEAGIQSAIGLGSGVANIFAPGSGTIASTAIDAARIANDMGAFNDGVIYKDGSYAKFSKGDMVQFIDQAAMERAASSNNTSGSKNSMQHTGVITIKSDDGKVVTWDQMYAARDLIGSRLSSIGESYENGFGNYQNPYKSPIQPLL
jgi:hypothetical protein